jgi:hypothetical protein
MKSKRMNEQKSNKRLREKSNNEQNKLTTIINLYQWAAAKAATRGARGPNKRATLTTNY